MNGSFEMKNTCCLCSTS